MTESTLSAAFEEIRIEVADFLGYGRSSSGWDSDTSSRLAAIIKAGVHQFYFPPKIQADKDPHKWSFLTPVASLTTEETYSTGTVEVSNNVCTLTGGTWPTWAATNGRLTIGSTEYPISGKDGIYLYVSGVDVAAGATFTLEHDGNYTLPDNFGSMISQYMTFNDDIVGPRVNLTGEGQIRTLRQGDNVFGQPKLAAVRPKTSTGSTGQRWELLLYPIPDDTYTLYYRYRLLPDSLSTGLYPYGGAAHTQTIIQSCMAMAELKMDGKRGPQWEQFVTMLTASIEQDLEVGRVMNFGYNGDNSPRPYKSHDNGNYVVTINGIDPDNL